MYYIKNDKWVPKDKKLIKSIKKDDKNKKTEIIVLSDTFMIHQISPFGTSGNEYFNNLCIVCLLTLEYLIFLYNLQLINIYIAAKIFDKIAEIIIPSTLNFSTTKNKIFSKIVDIPAITLDIEYSTFFPNPLAICINTLDTITVKIFKII